MLKKTIIILIFFKGFSLAQKELSLFQQQNTISTIQQRMLEKNSYRYSLHDHVLPAQTDSLVFGLELNAGYKNSALSPYEAYNDQVKYVITPFLYYTMDENLSFKVRVNTENIRDDYVYKERIFWSDEFANHRGDFEIAKLEYKTENIEIKFGRDYYMPGVYFYENLLFSKYNYPYDQLNITFHNQYFTISSFYLALNTTSADGFVAQRHFNGHRFTFNLGHWGYLAFNDVMLYGGENKAIDLMSFNPLILFYPYRKNKKHIDGNNLMSLELFLQYQKYFLFTELLLDDYQADKDVPGDLEPPEWGMNITFGINSIINNVDWKINYTHIANRTFNAPDFNFEKYIYKNYPIGHFLGNNFWELKTTLSYSQADKFITDLTFHYYEYGEEALYSQFNKDFLEYTVEQGYDEPFPFGDVKKQMGLNWSSFYSINENLLTKFELSYWIKNSLLENNFNFSVGFAYKI